MVKLRNYQQKAVEAILKHWERHKAALLVQATGTGKTIVFADVARRIIEAGGRVLILAHRDELIRQATDKILVGQGIRPGIEKATQYAKDEPIVIASVQTLGNARRLSSFSPDSFSHIIIDEAHHAAAEQYLRILNYFEAAKLLGVTATPYRGDDKSLNEIFDGITYEYTLNEAIHDRYLSKISFKRIPLKIDISKVRQSRGDFLERELGASLEPYLEEIAKIMETECRGRKTVVFLPLIATAIRFAEILRAHNFRALEIDGKTPNRTEILEAFKAGEIEVLCNSMLLTEGWDCPPVDCIINLRPTRSKTLYIQALGRGTRIAPGKKDLLVLDFLWQSKEYDICSPAVLTAESNEVEEALEALLDSGEETDLSEATQKAENSVREAREAKLAKRLKDVGQQKKKLISPILFVKALEDEALDDYYPEFHWQALAPTEKQIAVLEQNGIDGDEVYSKGYASALIDKVISRSKLGLATPKQLNYLKRRGFSGVQQWTKEEAGEVISAISRNNWKVPKAYSPKKYMPERIIERMKRERT